MKSTITSWPMRGIWMKPKPLPAQVCDTRTKQELFWSFLPSRSQWNCTFTRAYSSVKISSPEGPTTVAVCGPRMTGRREMRGGR